MSNQDEHVILDKELRRDIDAIIQRLRSASTPKRKPVDPTITKADLPRLAEEDAADRQKVRASRERSLALTKLQEAVMWLGMDLKAIGEETPGYVGPYPNAKDPSNTIIDRTADNLKL